jgi:transcriptional regulator with XRE-family HTH domain
MIGERLKKLRKAQKIRQEDLAAVIGVQKSSISLYEMNKNYPSDKVKVEIAKFFNISLDYLLGIVDEPVPYYNEKKFIMLPDDISKEERQLLSDVIEFIEYRKHN